MSAYEGKYLARDINLITTNIANIKKPSIYFEKVDKAKPDTKLKGAEFELQKKNEKGDYEAVGKDGKATSILNPKWIAESGEDGKFSFEKIPEDGTYRVYETKAPAGYSLIERVAFKFQVKNGKIYSVDKKTDTVETSTLKVKGEENSDTNRIPITNQQAEYPYTGGPGTWIGFTIMGLAVMIGGVFIYNKRQARLAE